MHASQRQPKPSTATPEERRSVRLMVQLDATIDDGKVARMCHTENLSKSGMLVRTRVPLPVGTEVDIQFLFRGDPALAPDELPGGYAFVEGQAMVVRHTHPANEIARGMGLRFLKLEEHGKNLLGKFLDLHNQGLTPGQTTAPA